MINFEKKTIFEEDIELSEASEPQNMIWEKKHIRDTNFIIRLVIAIGIIFLLLSLYFAAIFQLKKKSIVLDQQYPKVNCDQFYESYNDLKI